MAFSLHIAPSHPPRPSLIICHALSCVIMCHAVTVSAIKAVDASLQVGGPATAQLLWIPDFINWARSGGVPVDFVSSHLYPTDPAVDPGRDGFFAAINASAAVAAAAGLPLVMTEFNTGLGIPNGASTRIPFPLPSFHSC